MKCEAVYDQPFWREPVVYSYSILIWPDGALAIVFLIFIGVLIWRPCGLFGTELRT